MRDYVSIKSKRKSAGLPFTTVILAPMTTQFTAQEIFDRKYINTAELVSIMGVSRVAIWHARERGDLPEAIFIGKTCLWEREVVAPFVAKWQEKRCIAALAGSDEQ